MKLNVGYMHMHIVFLSGSHARHNVHIYMHMHEYIDYKSSEISLSWIKSANQINKYISICEFMVWIWETCTWIPWHMRVFALIFSSKCYDFIPQPSTCMYRFV